MNMRRKSPSLGSVYFIVESGWELDPGESKVKIGYTSGSPRERMRTLQTGSPSRLELVASFDGGESLEKAFHKAFSPLRLHGEWFLVRDKLRHFMWYFCNAKGAPHIGANALEDAVHDNILSDLSPHPEIPQERWILSANPNELRIAFPALFEGCAA
mgnify:FL=1